ncbi:MAG: efflux RND transporter periplasmic adaptor subunit [Clostridia bacterium]|nr:efflux RND transporter periplasmic adaptor subunit [Clostridia bacterium]
MNKRVISFLLAAVWVISLAGCGKKEAETETAAKGENVTVYEANISSIHNSVTYTGEIRASESVSVISKLSAKAEQVYYNEGDYVAAGTVVARLDGTDAQLALEQARAGYNSAVAAYNMTVNSTTKQAASGAEQAYNTAKLAYDTALTTYNREKQLYDNNTSLVAAKNALATAEKNYEDTKKLFEMGAVSQFELDNAQNSAENAKAAYDSASAGASAQLTGAESNLKSAENALKNAEENLTLTKISSEESIATAKASVQTAKASLAIAENNAGNTVVKAPISGYIASMNIHPGQLAPQGSELFSVKNADYVDAEISVTESVIPYIHEGDVAGIEIESAGISTSGFVTVANPVKNPQTGMYTVKVGIENISGDIKVGMFADITLTTQKSDSSLIIMSNGLLRDGDEVYVFVVNGDKAEKRIITTGIEAPDYTEVTTGLEAGEQVVIDGKEFLSETNNSINITSVLQEEIEQ